MSDYAKSGLYLIIGHSALGYAAFGKDIQTVVLVNLPQEDRFVNVVQLLYSLAIMLSTPLQLFPAVRIMEQGIFSEKSGKYSNRVKWQKNVFRSLVVVGCAMISWAGARDLDKFVSLVGSVACVPLAFILPSALYLKAVARTKFQMISSIAIIVFGLTMMAFTSVQTVRSLFESAKAALIVRPRSKCSSAAARLRRQIWVNASLTHESRSSALPRCNNPPLICRKLHTGRVQLSSAAWKSAQRSVGDPRDHTSRSILWPLVQPSC